MKLKYRVQYKRTVAMVSLLPANDLGAGVYSIQADITIGVGSQGGPRMHLEIGTLYPPAKNPGQGKYLNAVSRKEDYLYQAKSVAIAVKGLVLAHIKGEANKASNPRGR